MLDLINKIFLSTFMFGHTLTEAAIIGTFLFLLWKFGFKIALIGTFTVLVVHENEWSVVAYLHHYATFTNFIAVPVIQGGGGLAFWVTVGFLLYVFFFSKKFDYRMLGSAYLAMIPYYIFWWAIGLPVYETYGGYTKYANVPWVNALSIFSWAYIGIMYCIILWRFKREKR